MSGVVKLPDEFVESCQFIPYSKNRATKMATNADQLNDQQLTSFIEKLTQRKDGKERPDI